MIVAGDCATVGAAGGYTQGGGHSALSSKFGLGADQALEWEVIDGRGQLLTASRTENTDLYWALSGGGGGTYGVVYSLTLKAYQDFPVTGVVLSFAADAGRSDQFFDAIGYYHTLLPSYTAAGGVAIAEITNTSFLLTPLTFPDMNASRATQIMQPFMDYLDKADIQYKKNITQFSSFLQHYNTLIEPNPTQLVENGQYGGRFIPRSVIDDSNDNLTAAVRSITEDGVVFVGIGLNVSSTVIGNDVYNSVNPSWRDSAMSVILSSWVTFPPQIPTSHMPLMYNLQTLAEWRKPFRYGRSSEEDDGEMGAQAGCPCTRFRLLHERGKLTQRICSQCHSTNSYFKSNGSLLMAVPFSLILARPTGNMPSMAPTTRVSTRSRKSMILIICSMGTPPWAVMNGKCRVTERCVGLGLIEVSCQFSWHIRLYY